MKATATLTMIMLLCNTAAAAAAPDGDQATKNAKACKENLAKLDGSTEQWALEYKQLQGAKLEWQDVLDPERTGKMGGGYLRKKPVCPSGGKYTLGPVGNSPTCSIGVATNPEHSHVLAPFIVEPPKAKDIGTTSSR